MQEIVVKLKAATLLQLQLMHFLVTCIFLCSNKEKK